VTPIDLSTKSGQPQNELSRLFRPRKVGRHRSWGNPCSATAPASPGPKHSPHTETASSCLHPIAYQWLDESLYERFCHPGAHSWPATPNRTRPTSTTRELRAQRPAHLRRSCRSAARATPTHDPTTPSRTQSFGSRLRASAISKPHRLDWHQHADLGWPG
jgi:hypothetical protein